MKNIDTTDNDVKNKKRWDAPRVIELDFSETRVGKKPGGADGEPPERGNFKTGS